MCPDSIHIHAYTIQDLPVELLYEIQLYALAPSFPCLSHYFYDIFKTSPISFRLQYLLASCSTSDDATDILSKALRYPICTLDVLDLLWSDLSTRYANPSTPAAAPSTHKRKCELPRRIFRKLSPPVSNIEGKDALSDRASTYAPYHESSDDPIPFMLHLLAIPNFPPLDFNSHNGYALTRAVHAKHVPLVGLLLDLGASPACKGGMAVKVAIKQRNISMVKMLVERDDRNISFPGYKFPVKAIGNQEKEEKGVRRKGKRRRLEDRVEVDQSMLKLAVKCNAREIIDYLAWEKGIVPDMQTLNSLRV